MMSFAALALSLTLATAFAGDKLEGLPQRKPDGGMKLQVEIDTRIGSLDLNRSLEGKLGFERQKGARFRAVIDFSDASNGDTAAALSGERIFDLTDAGDAKGGALASDALPKTLPAIDTTDFALVPLRLLFRHEMPTSIGGKNAERELLGKGFHAKIAERFSGVKTISITPLQKFRGTLVRTFSPSGLQIVDHFLTYEDERDNSVMGGFCLRMLVHPSAVVDGKRPAGGVLYLSIVRMQQIDWLKERTVIPDEIWDDEQDAWYPPLAEDLFLATQGEALGDPFDSPSAVALRTLGALDGATYNRMATVADAHMLATIAPLLLDMPITFECERFDAAYDKTADPVSRLLLGAAAARAGSKLAPRYRADLELALHSKHAQTLRAAFCLARALDDDSVVAALAGAIATAQDDALKALGVYTLGSLSGSQALPKLEALDVAGAGPLTKAALQRALADQGNTAAIGAGVGGIDPRTGEFAVFADAPSSTLEQVTALAQAVKDRDVDATMTRLGTLLAGERSMDPGKQAVGAIGREWLARLGPMVLSLGPLLDDDARAPLARRALQGSGGPHVADLLRKIQTTKGAERKQWARLAGATRHPKVKALLLKLNESRDTDEYQAGSAGYDELSRDG